MVNRVQCPHCGQSQLPSIRVKTVEPPDGMQGIQDPRTTRYFIAVLLLSMTIIGPRLAYELCRRYEREYAMLISPAVSYSYQCGLCGFSWTWCTDESLLHKQAQNSLRRGRKQKTMPITVQITGRYLSFLGECVAWWFRV